MNAACEQYEYATLCERLPYTGLDLFVIVFVGLALLITGIWMAIRAWRSR